MAYSLPVKKIDVSQVGVNYHLALGTSSTIGAANDRIFGYCLVPDSKLGILRQQTDLSAKNKLTSYSSELLIDRDFVSWPRVTDGDFSGGALQQVYLDTSRYFDSDLDVRVPGQLFLNPAWQRTATLASGLGTISPQCISWNGSAYATFQEANGKIYKQDGTFLTFPSGAAKLIATDDASLFASDGVNNIQYASTAGTWTSLTSTSGTIKQMWIVNQGTSGRFLYFTADNKALQKQDLNIAWAPVSVPTATLSFTIVDMAPYLAGVAILTQPQDSARAFDVWYHDGANMTRIIRAEGYSPTGMVNALGQLYVTAQDSGSSGIPVLIRIGAGSFDIVARTAVPVATQASPPVHWWLRITSKGTNTAPTIGAPVSVHHYVYFSVINPQVNGISTSSYIGVYDVLNGAYWHLPNMDTADTPPDLVRSLAVVGRSVVFPRVASGNGTLQFQVNNANLALGGFTGVYQPSGWMVSSRIDFNTPGISKMFRRVVVHHKPLAAGESVVVRGFVDQEPINFTTSLTATASITNSTLSSNNTVLTFAGSTQGHSMYFAIQLNAGSGQLTTPIVYYAATEISTPWGFEFSVDATSKRQMLSGAPDNQGLMGRDLWMLLKLAWEGGQTVTYYDTDGSNYVCTIERLERFNPSPQFQSTPLHAQDIESWLSVVLRVTNEN